VRDACRGIYVLLSTQPHAKIHLMVSVAVLALMCWLKPSSGRVCLLVFALCFVWVTEALNTALESLADHITEDYSEKIRISKDVAAGAVLIAVMGAVVIGLVVFLPLL